MRVKTSCTDYKITSVELYANLTACIMRLHQLLHSAAPREITGTAIIELGFASCDYCINLHSAAPRAINSVIALYAVRLAYIILKNFIIYFIILKCFLFINFFPFFRMPLSKTNGARECIRMSVLSICSLPSSSIAIY